MRCGIYERVSTERKGRKRQDTENQGLQLRDFAASQGWTLVKEYIDRASGGNSDRTAFEQMFEDASQRKFDVLLFWSLDRLSREGALATLQHLNRLTGYGVQWRSFSEQYLDSTGVFRDAVIGILAVIAKQEKIRISERTKAGLERVRLEGKTLGRPVVAVDRKQIHDLRARGFSWRAIARSVGISRGTLMKAICSKTFPSRQGIPAP